MGTSSKVSMCIKMYNYIKSLYYKLIIIIIMFSKGISYLKSVLDITAITTSFCQELHYDTIISSYVVAS